MNSDSGQSALNAVLRLDPGEGFFLEREHATYGALVLPIADLETLNALEDQGDEDGVPASELEALEKTCRAYANGANFYRALGVAFAFSQRFPLSHRGHYLKSVFYERTDERQLAADSLRCAIAVQPTMFYLSELGRVLGKMGDLQGSGVVLKHCLDLPVSEASRESWRRAAEDYLVTLTRQERGDEMVQVADRVIGELGESSLFQYQAILGLMIQEKFQEASDRLQACKPRLTLRGQMVRKFAQLEQILTGKLLQKQLNEAEAGGVAEARLRRVVQLLKLEPTGFSVPRTHERYGTLVLPMDHCSVTNQDELEALQEPATVQGDLLAMQCQRHVDRRDYSAAFDRAGEFLTEFPFSAYAHQLQGAYREAQKQFEDAMRHLRKSAAIDPSYAIISDMGRVLFKLGDIEDSAVMLSYAFSIRGEERSQLTVRRGTLQLLTVLGKLRKGEELLHVAKIALAEHGSSSSLEYHAALGEMLTGDYRTAERRIDSVLSRIRETDPGRKDLEVLVQILQELKAQNRFTPAGFQLILGQEGFVGPFETFEFSPGRLKAFSEADPSKTLEFELGGEVVDGLVSRLLDASFISAARGKGIPDASLRFVEASDARSGKPQRKGVVFSRSGVLADTEGVGPALAPVLELVEAVWIYRTAGDLPAGMTRLPSAGATASWSVEEVSTLQYQIGNEHSPTDRMGRQVLRIGADDRFEVQWYRREGALQCQGTVRPGLFRTLLEGLHSAGFPEIAGELPPPGAALADYRVERPAGHLEATLYPGAAEKSAALSPVQRVLNQLTRELAGPGSREPSGWIEDQGEWHEL